MKVYKKLIFIILLLIILLATLSIIYFYNYNDLKNDYDSLVDQRNDLLIIDKEEYKDNVIKYANAVQVASLYYPDHFIYYGKGGIQFKSLNKDYFQNDYHKKESVNNFISSNNKLIYNDDNTTSSFGIDISEHQNDIDWDLLVKQGVDYVFIRVGYRGYASGEIHLDDMFVDHISNANRVNIPVGVYFFSGAINEFEALEEANFVLENIKDYNVELEIAFDMEEILSSSNRMKNLSNEERTHITKVFLDTVKSFGYEPVLYGNSKWLMDYLNYQDLLDYPIWFANYSGFSWPYQVLYYQYTESLNIDGIKGKVDGNIKFIKK